MNSDHGKDAAPAVRAFNDLLRDTRRLADTYAFLAERFTRFEAGKLNADDLLLILQHQMRFYQDDVAIQHIYQQALRDFTRTQAGPTEP